MWCQMNNKTEVRERIQLTLLLDKKIYELGRKHCLSMAEALELGIKIKILEIERKNRGYK